jgi:hypothetical protein
MHAAQVGEVVDGDPRNAVQDQSHAKSAGNQSCGPTSANHRLCFDLKRNTPIDFFYYV